MNQHIRKRNYFPLFLAIIFLILLLVNPKIGFTKGNTLKKQTTPKSRALEIGYKECYTNQDIEYIVFGEKQE